MPEQVHRLVLPVVGCFDQQLKPCRDAAKPDESSANYALVFKQELEVEEQKKAKAKSLPA